MRTQCSTWEGWKSNSKLQVASKTLDFGKTLKREIGTDRLDTETSGYKDDMLITSYLKRYVSSLTSVLTTLVLGIRLKNLLFR